MARAVTQEMIRLYDDYTHLTLDRRGFLDQLTRMAGSAAAAAAIVPMLEARAAAAAQVTAEDARIAGQDVTWGDGMGGYLVRPADATGPLPTVMVIHENRGLNGHIRDVARRAALAGYTALAPDFLAPGGGTPADEDRAREMIQAMDPEATEAHLLGTAAFLRGHPLGTGRVGAVGFCWGGGMVGALAVGDPALDAGVVYYGRQPDPAAVPAIKAPLLLHYAGLDDRINAGIPAFEAAMKDAGTRYTLHVYDGVNHAFNNDTAQARYDAAAAELAWGRTLAFFAETLG